MGYQPREPHILTERLRDVIVAALQAHDGASKDERDAIYARARRQLLTWATDQYGADAEAVDAVTVSLEHAIADVEAEYHTTPNDLAPGSAATEPKDAFPNQSDVAPRRSPDAATIIEMLDESGPGSGEGASVPPEVVKRRPSPQIAAALTLLIAAGVVILAQPSTTAWIGTQMAGLTWTRIAADAEQPKLSAPQESALSAAAKQAFSNDAVSVVVMVERGDFVRASAVPISWARDGDGDLFAVVAVPEYGVSVRVETPPSQDVPQHLYASFDQVPNPLLRGLRPTKFEAATSQIGKAIGDVASLNATTLMYGIDDREGVEEVAIGAELGDGTRLTLITQLPERRR